MTIRLVLVDDQALVRSGLLWILSDEPDLEVVAQAADGAAAIEAVRAHRPDVVLMDLRMPHMDGLEAIRRLVADPVTARTRIVVLTTFETDEHVFAALRLGASGFLAKSVPPEELVAAVRAAAAGDAVLSPGAARRVVDEFARLHHPADPTGAAARLTDRELAVLRLLTLGLSNAEIGARLYIGEATVKTHVSALLAKLGLRDRVQAVVFAYEHGIVRPGDMRG